MNIIVKRTRMKYQNAREQACYSIFDIEYNLKKLAFEGLIWCLQGMPDMTKAEEILINHYLNEYRENQVYDEIISVSRSLESTY
ncbi:hypothetical protein [Fictibacillus phosphorivorans]|uniref:hypothetical protein n=1 Tax=Fictibacillus phosphorivorans TaxID=1221500 RepID=UPI00129308BF|nr:hypothetical protein [Fictibacillus phosphorivorans]MQR93691.1 hypothetical protein [Fictibacillus phosphorivorans]